MSSIVIKSDDVLKISNEIEQANKDLKKELTNTSEIMENLKSSWDSSAYRESNKAFQAFEKEYSENYDQIITAYVSFLRDTISKGYVSTEQANIDLASQYK